MSNNLLWDFDVWRGLNIRPARKGKGVNKQCGDNCTLCDAEDIKGEEIELDAGGRGFAYFNWLADSRWASELEERAFDEESEDGSVALLTWLWLDDFAVATAEFSSNCGIDMPQLEVAISRWWEQGAALVFLRARPCRIWMLERRVAQLEDEAMQCRLQG
jgi:hypothetical protein